MCVSHGVRERERERNVAELAVECLNCECVCVVRGAGGDGGVLFWGGGGGGQGGL